MSTDPAEVGFAITPSDSTVFEYTTRGLWIGGAGNVKVDMNRVGTAVLISGIPAGTLLPIRVTKVYSTDTTATNIVGFS